MKYISTFIFPFLLLVLASATFADTYQEKEAAIHTASERTLQNLIKSRKANTLNDDTALAIIQEEISPQFDYAKLTQFVVGKNWRKANEQERTMIIDLFRRLVERTYAKALAKFTDQRVAFVPAQERGDGSVIVGIKVLNAGKSVLIEYQLKEQDSSWNVTDVKIENISLLSNYRRQFDSIIRKKGMAGLILLLQTKV